MPRWISTHCECWPCRGREVPDEIGQPSH
jgi:hypothetical protein